MKILAHHDSNYFVEGNEISHELIQRRLEPEAKPEAKPAAEVKQEEEAVGAE